MLNFLRRPQKPVVDEPNHSSIRSIDPYDFQVAHKRLAWMFRSSVIINVCLCVALVTNIAVIRTMLPLKEVRVALVKADSQTNRVYRIEPISPETSGYNLVLETIARGFLVDAFTIDPLSNTARSTSGLKVMTKQYQDKYLDSYINNGWLQDVMDSGLIRSILIQSTDHMDNMGTDNPLLSIDYIQIDTRNGVELERKRMRATVLLALRPQEVKKSEMYTNPLGVFVLDVTTREIQG